MISNTGGGYSFHIDPKERRILRYRYNNLPLDRPGRYIYIKDIDSFFAIPGFQNIWMLRAFMVQPQHTLIGELGADALSNNLFINDDGRTGGAKVAGWSKHDTRRSLCRINKVGIMLLRGRLASWAGC